MKQCPKPCKDTPDNSSSTLFLLYRQILVFPILVVLLASTSFLFGGRCATWQWWTSVVSVTLIPLTRRKQWPAAVRAAGLFVLLLFALRYLIPPLVWDRPSPSDMSSCHLPMIQLLIEGWNPVADPTAEEISSSLGLDLWGMASLHIAFSMKALAVFSAVAFMFIRDPFALTFPLLVFLWIGVLLCAVRSFSGLPRRALIAALVFVLPMVPRQMPVDLGLAFTSCGLLLTLHSSLRKRECDWLSLLVWGTWMMTLKINGMLFAFVFGMLFVAARTLRMRAEWKRCFFQFTTFCISLLILFGIISWNPFGTSWRTYGHPLYPYCTSDAKLYPVKDLAWDMQLGNQDFREMGRMGLLAHAFLSRKGTISFYRTRFGNNGFSPDCEWWHLRTYLPDGLIRLEIWLVFALLLLFPSGRLWAFGGITLLFAVPLAMIGYTRYQPWLSALGCLAVVLAMERVGQLLTESLQKKLSFVVGTVLCLAFLAFMKDKSEDIECKAMEVRTIHKEIRPNFAWMPGYLFQMVSSVKHFVPRFNYLSFMENRCRLLVKGLGRDQKTIIIPESQREHPHIHCFCFDERELLNYAVKPSSAFHDDPSMKMSNPYPANEHDRLALFQALGREAKCWTKGWILTPFGYYVPDDEHAKHYHLFLEKDAYSDNQTVWFRLRMCCGSFFHAWFVTYPKEVWRRLSWNQ